MVGGGSRLITGRAASVIAEMAANPRLTPGSSAPNSGTMREGGGPAKGRERAVRKPDLWETDDMGTSMEGARGITEEYWFGRMGRRGKGIDVGEGGEEVGGERGGGIARIEGQGG